MRWPRAGDRLAEWCVLRVLRREDQGFEAVIPGQPATDRRGVITEEIPLGLGRRGLSDRSDGQCRTVGPVDRLVRDDPAVLPHGMDGLRHRVIYPWPVDAWSWSRVTSPCILTSATGAFPSRTE